MECKVLIIGAGPTGLFSALHLIKQGINDIIIVNKSNHKVHKCCSGFLTSKTVKLMEELDINLEDIGYKKGTNLETYYNNKLVYKLNNPEVYLYFSPSANREELDDWLYNLVLDKGVRILENQSIESINIENKIVNLKDKNISFEQLIMADGFVGISSKYNKKTKKKMIGFEVKIENETKKEPKVDLNFNITSRGYAWVFQQFDYTTIGFTDLYNHRIDYRSLLESFAQTKNISINTKDIRGAFIPCQVKKLVYNDYSYFAGDAAGLVDALTQEGLFYSILSSKYVSEAISANNYHIYLKKMKPYLRELKLSYFLAKLFYKPMIQDFIWNSASTHSFKTGFNYQ